MGIRLRTVDAFTDKPFSGNPAAVVMMDDDPGPAWMAAVAREMNLSETAFVIRESVPDADFRLRWFTPTVEVDLCGHATLAAAHCLFEDGCDGTIRFATRSGVLTVDRQPDGSLAMDFPVSPAQEIAPPQMLMDALSVPSEWAGRTETGFLLAIVESERVVRELRPDLSAIARLAPVAVIVSALADPGCDYDFLSRVFGPNVGLDEDPVTGSAHTVLAPYWADRLGRTSLIGLQASARSGLVGVELTDSRVIISGRALTVFDGALSATASACRGRRRCQT